MYHKDTNDWILDDEGCYRTSDGYFVIASSDYSKGTVLKISKGYGKVLDCGCESGTIDLYVSW